MSYTAVVLANSTSTAIVAAEANSKACILRITATNRNAAAVSLIALDGTTEICRWHLAAAGGQINIGYGDPAFPVFPASKHTKNTVFNLQQSANQDGVVGDVLWTYRGA